MRNVYFLFITIICFGCGSQKTNENLYSRAELKERTFNYFWNAVDTNFQTLDRYPSKTFSSIAATGFGLSSYIEESKMDTSHASKVLKEY